LQPTGSALLSQSVQPAVNVDSFISTPNMSVARRERKYGADSDRSKRVPSQPVQAW
jgi:hypothetical protein